MIHDDMREVLDDLFEEIEGSRHYAKLAIKLRDTDKERADGLMEMSRQEMGHAEKLHAQGVKIAKRYEDDVGVQAVWTYCREKAMDMMADVKALQAAYK